MLKFINPCRNNKTPTVRFLKLIYEYASVPSFKIPPSRFYPIYLNEQYITEFNGFCSMRCVIAVFDLQRSIIRLMDIPIWIYSARILDGKCHDFQITSDGRFIQIKSIDNVDQKITQAITDLEEFSITKFHNHVKTRDLCMVKNQRYKKSR